MFEECLRRFGGVFEECYLEDHVTTVLSCHFGKRSVIRVPVQLVLDLIELLPPVVRLLVDVLARQVVVDEELGILV